MFKLIISLCTISSIFAVDALSRQEIFPDTLQEKFAQKIEEDKIVGGIETELNSRPYQVSLQNKDGKHFCGGIIINKKFIATAAHCCVIMDKDVTALVGKHNLEHKEATEQSLTLRKIITHEEYDEQKIKNDICVLKTRGKIIYSSAVQPVTLPKQYQTFTGMAKVSGWGALTYGGSSSPILREVSIPLVSDEVCRTNYGETAIDMTMTCAGEKGRNSCQGDSGGPLTCGPNLDILCGIVSWGRGCALEGYPAVYTEVAYYTDWIKLHTKTPCYRDEDLLDN